jgi:hypothetical protein
MATKKFGIKLRPDKEATPVEQYQEIILGIRIPTEKQEQQMKRYDAIHDMLISGKTKFFIMKVLQRHDRMTGLDPLKKAQCYKLISDAEQIYGVITNSDNRAAKKEIAIENMKRIANLAIKVENHNAAVRAWEQIIKMEDYYKEDLLPIDPDEWSKPVDVIFTSDPKVLRKEQGQDITDADYEVIDTKDD